MPGARRTHSLARKDKQSVRANSPQVRRNHPALPARWLYGLLRALPGVSGLVATVAREIVHELDPSVEGTGPHGLTVRDMPHVLRPVASTASLPAES